MDITFIGAARTVTGSLHLFEYNGQKFLLECGLYQGHREEAERINRTFPFKPKDIKAVILSHAHIDHSGNLPNLVKRGFTGPIYCTSATKDIASLLLLDSAKIQEYDLEYFNKKQKKKGLPLKEPLYTVADAEKTLKQFSTVEYKNTFEPVNGVKVTFYDAGVEDCDSPGGLSVSFGRKGSELGLKWDQFQGRFNCFLKMLFFYSKPQN